MNQSCTQCDAKNSDDAVFCDNCGTRLQRATVAVAPSIATPNPDDGISNTNQVNVTISAIAQSQKSTAVAGILAFFFGPLGMFYSTVSGALIMILINTLIILPIMVFTAGFGAILYFPSWLVGIVWAVMAASKQNTISVK
jgi:hypothetical protein